jgi:hypothetical protein
MQTKQIISITFAVLFCGACKAQTTSPVSGQPASLPPITGAKVEEIKLDRSAHAATVTIRNLADKPITAFDLVVRTIRTDKQPGVSDASFRLRDLLPGISAGQLEGIRPGETFDEVIQGVSSSVAIDIDFIAFSDASAESTNPEILKHVMAVRKAIADANNKTKEIIRTASSKEEAISNLTRLWEESKETAPLETAVLETQLYNLKKQNGDSADERQRMLEYADKNERDAQFISVHANLHRRAQ